MTTGMAKTHGQVRLSTMSDEMIGPRMPPAPAKPAHTPTALSRSSGGNVEVAPIPGFS